MSTKNRESRSPKSDLHKEMIKQIDNNPIGKFTKFFNDINKVGIINSLRIHVSKSMKELEGVVLDIMKSEKRSLTNVIKFILLFDPEELDDCSDPENDIMGMISDQKYILGYLIGLTGEQMPGFIEFESIIEKFCDDVINGNWEDFHPIIYYIVWKTWNSNKSTFDTADEKAAMFQYLEKKFGKITEPIKNTGLVETSEIILQENEESITRTIINILTLDFEDSSEEDADPEESSNL